MPPVPPLPGPTRAPAPAHAADEAADDPAARAHAPDIDDAPAGHHDHGTTAEHPGPDDHGTGSRRPRRARSAHHLSRADTAADHAADDPGVDRTHHDPAPLPGKLVPLPRDLAPRLAEQAFEGVEVGDITDSGAIIGVGYYNDEIVGFELPPTGPVRLLRGAPGDRDVIAWAGNTHGLVVGQASNPETGRPVRAVAWDAGRLTELEPRLPTFGGAVLESMAWDVNERGQVVGAYSLAFEIPSLPTTTLPPSTRPPDQPVIQPPSTTMPPTTGGVSTRPPTSRPVPPTTTPPLPLYREAYLAFVWDSVTDRVTVLNPEAATSTEQGHWTIAVAIADNGIVGGHTEPQAVRWRPGTGGRYVAEYLGNGMVTSVNAAGDTVGTILTPERSQAAFWPGDSTVPIVMPDRTDADERDLTEALKVNDAGVVAGNVWAADGRVLPLRWPARATKPPEQLHPDGSFVAVVRGLNAAGAVAGWAGVPPDQSSFRLLVWDP